MLLQPTPKDLESIQALRFLLAILGRVHGALPYSNGSQRQVYSGHRSDHRLYLANATAEPAVDRLHLRCDERFQQQVDMA
jgi:hypothetical protein